MVLFWEWVWCLDFGIHFSSIRKDTHVCVYLRFHRVETLSYRKSHMNVNLTLQPLFCSGDPVPTDYTIVWMRQCKNFFDRLWYMETFVFFLCSCSLFVLVFFCLFDIWDYLVFVSIVLVWFGILFCFKKGSYSEI